MYSNRENATTNNQSFPGFILDLSKLHDSQFDKTSLKEVRKRIEVAFKSHLDLKLVVLILRVFARIL